MKITKIASLLGTNLPAGCADREISCIASPEGAGVNSITFISDAKYLESVRNCLAPVVIVKPGMVIEGKICLEVADPYLGYARGALAFEDRAPVWGNGISSRALVDGTADLAASVSVGPGAVIGRDVVIGENTEIAAGVIIEPGTVIGNDCRIDSNATIRKGCRIGSRVIIQSNTVIGSEGFANAMDGRRFVRIPCFGNVVIEDDVEIGACVTIDRGNFEPTIIRKGARIDNLVQVAHNVQVGENAALAAQVGIAGSTKIGSSAILAGQAGITGHITIGDGAFIAAKAGVSKDVPPMTKMTGYPAREFMTMRRIDAAQSDLPQMRRDVMELKKTVELLKNHNPEI